MKLTVVGCSPSWPSPGGAQSGYLIEEIGGSLLLDCGPGVLSALRREHPWPQPDAIVLSHLHLDHWGDLVSWVWGAAAQRSFGRYIPRPALWLPPGGSERLAEFARLLDAPGMFAEAFEVSEYPVEEPFGAADCTLWAFPVTHFGSPAYALRLECAGRTLTYSGDSGPCDSLVEAARDADLLLCEATLDHDETQPGPRGHLTLDEAKWIFERSGAAELLVTHRPAELPVPPDIPRAHDGLAREV